MSIEAKRDQIVEELMPFDDHYERFAYIIDRAKSHPPLDEAYKIDTFLIEGCLSQLWIFPEFKDGRCYFHTDSDAAITKGCLLYTSPSPRDVEESRMPSSA